jgi:Concanavalin A-like lectin/glucanases superfamily
MTGAVLSRLRYIEPSGDTDPLFANVILLCGFEGADGSTSFVDESSFARTLTAVNNAQIDTAQFKFGASSYLGDGTDDRVSAAHNADMNLGSGDFTIECWARFNASGINQGVLGKYASISANAAWVLERLDNNALQFRFYDGTTEYSMPASGIPVNSNWHHLVAERAGNNCGVAVNGIFGTLSSVSGRTINAGTDALTIGARVQGGFTTSINGHLDEVRITKGSNRYNLTNFTPPTAAFPRS